MKQKIVPIIALCIFFLTLFSSCAEDKLVDLEPACENITVRFAVDIAPIFSTNCDISGCHSASTNNVYDASDYNSIANNAERIYNALNAGIMPQGKGRLPECEIQKIRSWIDAGKLNN